MHTEEPKKLSHLHEKNVSIPKSNRTNQTNRDKTDFDPFAKIPIETSSNAISKHWSSSIKFLHEYLIKLNLSMLIRGLAKLQ